MVTRKSENGEIESVPMEMLKETDEVLVTDKDGVRFAPIVALDIHDDYNGEEIVSIETENGHSMSLTPTHMVIVHSTEGEKLVLAGDVKPGMHIEVVDENLSDKT